MAGKASLFGVDLSGGSVARNLMGKKAPEGATFYDNELGKLLVRDDRLRGLVTLDGAPLLDTSANSVYFADHFLKTPLAGYDVTKGTGATVFAIDPTVKSGAVKGTTGAAGTGIAADGLTLALNAPVQASATSVIEFSTSLKLQNALETYFFIGFTDVLPAVTLELPVSIAAVTYTTTATDAVGFLYDPVASVDTVRLVGVAADVDAAHVDTGFVPVANQNYDFHLRLEGRTASFSIDGVTFAGSATLPNAVSAGVNLYPIVIACARAAQARDVWVDFFRGGKYAA